jgi:hypothetical protein
MEMYGQLHTPAALSLGKESLVPTGQEGSRASVAAIEKTVPDKI